ncbi:MAG: Bifunctional protein GlmU [Owenweeksia sp. TMED14]|nr:MAG: Bifunctional protein GlmU [Owenweeksia sp. TMED14]|tara:strand:+ start:1655 stop:2809 length:1155 start_codon:yes stop_codon:yes gene_type:complete
MDIVFQDGPEHFTLKPLSLTRPVADLRIGILTIAEKWSKILDADNFSYATVNHLKKKFPEKIGELHIRGGLLPSKDLIDAIRILNDGERLISGDEWLAHRNGDISVEFNGNYKLVKRPDNLFTWNKEELESDFDLLTSGRQSEPIPISNKTFGSRIFIEKGAIVEASILNSISGSIYLARGSEIMEGSIVRGGFSLGEFSTLKAGAKIYGATTVGPFSKVGGEVNNSIIWGFSNKGHDGFLGNSVLGQWCNIGAGSSNSNLKNNYDEVKLYSYVSGSFESTDLTFCGLIMGDHSKCAINTSFNTGTVVGVSCNIFGAGFPRNFIPDFSWGGPQGNMEYAIEKALATAKRMMSRREVSFNEMESDILSAVHAQTSELRGGMSLAN